MADSPNAKIIKFIDDEIGYLKWIAEHPSGFVINANRNISARYLIAHRASCQTIRVNKNFTTGSYIKICGPDILAITDFIATDANISPPPVDYCRFCLRYHPTADEQVLERMTQIWLSNPSSAPPAGVLKPQVHQVTAWQHERDPQVRAWVLYVSKGRCELCNGEAPFLNSQGYRFLEVHHVKRLSDGGSDRTSNAVALCPNCHRSLHYAGDSKERAEKLYLRIERLRRE